VCVRRPETPNEHTARIQASAHVGWSWQAQRPANNGPCMGNGVRFERVRCEVAQPAPLNPIKLKACMSDIPTCMEKMCTCAGEVPMAASQKLHAMRNTHLLWPARKCALLNCCVFNKERKRERRCQPNNSKLLVDQENKRTARSCMHTRSDGSSTLHDPATR